MRVRYVFAAALVAAAAGGASASLTTPGNDVGWYKIDRSGAPVQPAAGITDRATSLVYADWSGAPGGAGVLNGGFQTGLNRIDGDRVTTLANGVNLLSDMGYSLYNLNPTGSTARITSFTANVNFYDGVSLALVGGFTGAGANLTGLAGGGLPAQSSVRLSFGAAALEFLNISLPTNVIIALTFTGVTFNTGTGTDANLVGQQVRNPVSIGSSTDELVLNGNIVADPFGAAPAPDGNFSYYLITNNIPAPGSMALIGLGGLLATRRRR